MFLDVNEKINYYTVFTFYPHDLYYKTKFTVIIIYTPIVFSIKVISYTGSSYFDSIFLGNVNKEFY